MHPTNGIMSCYTFILVLVLIIHGSNGFLSPINRPILSALTRARRHIIITTDAFISMEPNNDDIKASDLGEYNPAEKVTPKRRQVNVGDPQIKVQDKERSVTSILKELAAIQQQGPQKYCILGTRHCSFLHQQIIELL